MKINNTQIFLIGTLLMIIFVVFAFVFNHGIWLIFALGAMALANWSGSQEHKKKWNHGVCKETKSPWEFKEVIEYTETIDYCFTSDKYSLLIPPHDFKRSEYKGKNNF